MTIGELIVKLKELIKSDTKTYMLYNTIDDDFVVYIARYNNITYVTDDIYIDAKPVKFNSVVKYLMSLPSDNYYDIIEVTDRRLTCGINCSITTVSNIEHTDMVINIMELLKDQTVSTIEILGNICISNYNAIICRQQDTVYFKTNDITTILSVGELHRYLVELVKLTGI